MSLELEIVEEYAYREPVFTFDHAKKSWGEGFWALYGSQMLTFIRHMGLVFVNPSTTGIYEHRPGIAPNSFRRNCYIRPINVGEVPTDITNTYYFEDIVFPHNMTLEEQEKYMLQKSWGIVFFRWDTMTIKPYEFNTLLNKVLLLSDSCKQALVILDTYDLYVNVSPTEFFKRYNKPYPSKEVKEQQAAYEEWIRFAGFNRFYAKGEKDKLVPTPWYYRYPKVAEQGTNTGIKEYPPYQVHPLETTNGLYYPMGYTPEDKEE